jgi:formate hydrogenlyase transcriptional activator
MPSEVDDAARRAAGIEQPQRLLVRAWEALTTERELNGVLAAVAAVVAPVVPFCGIGIVAFEEGSGRLYALHVVGGGPGGPQTPPAALPSRPLVPYRGSDLGRAHETGQPYACADLVRKDGWLPHEFRLAAVGIRCYASVPLLARGVRIGAAVFGRRQPEAFTHQELTLLSDVSRALGVAVSNALANEEIRRLRDQVEAENVVLRSQLGRAQGFDEIVGDSPPLRRLLEAIEQVAATDATVLITGETGTGKELVARAVHRRSSRAERPLVTVHCAAIPGTLIAAELFGHERGAFTGAVERRKGRFEQAHGGTLFLDEVGELPPETQVTLLRVVQERELQRLGGSETVKVDVRLVVATNRDLLEEVRAGRFRSDLYYRLSVFPIRLPPLRERPEDIAPLVAHLATKHGTRFGRSISRIDRRSLKRLESYAWPGNVRELENVVERAVILSRAGILRVGRDALPASSMPGDVGAELRAREREAIESALSVSRGRVAGGAGAAARLGLAPSTLEFKIRRLGIDKSRYRSGSARS